MLGRSVSGWIPVARRGPHRGGRSRPVLPASIEALGPLLPTTYGIDEQVDWAVAEARWGAPFPADYKAFMRAYGEGSVDGAIVVHRPLPTDAEGGRTPDAMAEGTGAVQEAWRVEADEVWADPAGPDLVLDPGSLLAWGTTTEADILCWLTMDEDPDRWPVVVCGRHTVPTFALYRYGMAEFLRRLLTGAFEMSPITVDGVMGRSRHAFVSRAVQRARRRAGLDPWTGEPPAG